MASFDMLNAVKLYLRTGRFGPDASSKNRYRIKRAAQNFVYKDGCLLRKHRGRLLRVVTSDDHVREILLQLHNTNNHPGRMQMLQQIMSMYYWLGVTKSVKKWVENCEVCKARTAPRAQQIVKSCLAYGCDASSFLHPELTFHKFPKSSELRQQWVVVAQRDEGSVRRDSWLCSRHFEPDCFLLSDGQDVLRSDAVPTITGVSKQTAESQPSEPLFHPSSLEDLLTCAAATAEVSPVGTSADQSDPSHDEHQYSLRVPGPHPRETPAAILESRQSTSFTTYNHIARYLSHRVLPEHSVKKKYSLKRKAQRFCLIDGVLMYNMRSHLVRVPRSREEVNSILLQFHDNRGHVGYHTCFQALLKTYHWSSMSKDLHSWIARCPTCLKRSTKWLRCSIMNCTNYCGPVERKLGLTFHKFPIERPSLLSRWQKAAGRSSRWHPRLWSSVCSAHFTDDCFNRSGGRVELRPDAVPTVRTHGDEAVQSSSDAQVVTETENTDEQDEAFFAKFDAMELYISTRTYPPGLTFVEKNTFRRLCKKYLIKDEALYIRLRDRVVPVLRNRAQVNEALKEYHDELNHLDVKKCLRLLNERCFWKNMRPDIIKWISKCSVCSWKNKLKNPPKQKAQLLPPPLTMLRDPEFEADVSDENNEGSETESETETAKKVIEPEPKTQVQTPTQNRSSVQSRVKTTVHTKGQSQAQTKVQTGAQAKVQSQVWTQIQPKAQTQPRVLAITRVHGPIQKQKVQIPTLTKELTPVQPQTRVQVQNQPQIQIQTQDQTRVKTTVQAHAGAQNRVQTPVQASNQTKLQSLMQPRIKVRILNQPQVQSKVRVPVQAHTQVQTQVRAPVKIKFQPQVQTSDQTKLQSQIQPQDQTPVQIQSQIQVPTQVQSPVQTQVFIPAVVQSQDQALQTIPVLLALSAPVNLPPPGPIILSSPPDPALVAGLWSDKPKQKDAEAKEAPKQALTKDETEKTEIQIESPKELNQQLEKQLETIPNKKQVLRIKKVKVSHTEKTNNKTRVKQTVRKPTAKTHLPTHSSRGRPLKRKGFPDEEGLSKRVRSPGPELTVDLSSKRKKTHNEAPTSCVRPLEARVVLQQCNRAKVKTRTGVDGTEPKYAQIGEGLVVYVCFFDGATEDTAHRIADAVMNTQFFRGSGSRRQVSVLELPGGVLLLPQESLGWERGPHRSMRSRGVSEAWRGSQLFSSLVSHCREMLLQRGTTGGSVEQGVYGQRQEIELTSSEPMSHVLEF